MYAHVLSRLTPFGEDSWRTPNASDGDHGGPNARDSAGSPHLTSQAYLATHGWPTATASDAWAGEHNHSQVIPCNGRVLTGKPGLGLGQAARGETWPTPRANKVQVDNEGACNRVDQTGYHANIEEAVGIEHRGATGSLNPSWVETLLGYPIGYTLTEGEPLTTLPNVWPVDGGFGAWPTPKAGNNRNSRQALTNRLSSGARRPSDFSTEQAVEVAEGVMPKECESVDEFPQRYHQTWPAGLGAPQHEWEPPRLTTEKQHRASRLKALGNSIVPQVAVLLMEAIAAEQRNAPATCEGVQACDCEPRLGRAVV